MVKMKIYYKASSKYNEKALPESAGLCPWPAQVSESCCPKRRLKMEMGQHDRGRGKGKGDAVHKDHCQCKLELTKM